MRIAQVVAECEARDRDPDLESIHLAICETSDGDRLVAATELSVQVGDTVLLVEGDAAARALRIPNLPIDCTVCAVLSPENLRP